jgi:hypothetical protein
VDDDDISFDDLLDDEPASVLPATYEQLRADGFPRNGGVAELAAIARLPEPGERLAALQRGFIQILEKQQRN